MIERTFDLCVDLSVPVGCDTSYKRINVYISCIALPLVLAGQTAAIIWLACR